MLARSSALLGSVCTAASVEQNVRANQQRVVWQGGGAAAAVFRPGETNKSAQPNQNQVNQQPRENVGKGAAGNAFGTERTRVTAGHSAGRRYI